jgi:hypothetical protein
MEDMEVYPQCKGRGCGRPGVYAENGLRINEGKKPGNVEVINGRRGIRLDAF